MESLNFNKEVVTGTTEMQNPFLSKAIVSLKEFEQSGFKFAKLANNRKIGESNVKAKKKSIRSYGVISPITIVEASKAIAEGLEIVDFMTNNPVPAPENYFVAIDGQHRLEAVLGLKREGVIKDCFLMKPLTRDVTITKLLAIMNNEVVKWNGKDYPTYVVMTLNDKAPRLISEIANYTSRDYDLRSVYQYLTFDTDCFSIPQLSSIANGEGINAKLKMKLDNVSGIDRGKNIIEALEKKFGDDKIIKVRLFSDFIIGKHNTYSIEDKPQFEMDIISFIQSFTTDQVNEIKSVKGTKGVQTKEQKFNELLNGYYETFKEPELKEIA